MSSAPSRVLFLYWGRRGLTQLVLQVAEVARDREGMAVSVSRQNEQFADFVALEAAHEQGRFVVPVDTFAAHSGALVHSWRLVPLRRRILSRISAGRIEAVIELMPHVWTPFIAPAIRSAGVRFATIVHDADAHPGDYRTRLVKPLLDRSIDLSDRVLTLSHAVADRLSQTGRVPAHKLRTLFHPDLGAPSSTNAARPPVTGEPIRLMFLGRIMPYKGLPLFLDTVDILRAEGVPIEVGVFGEGALGASAQRLAAIGAEVVNRWLGEDEIASCLARYHAIVLSHIEASQSGIAAMALGAGLPVIATPVGGLREQIADGVTGALAARADAPALAAAVKRVMLDPVLYRAIQANIADKRSERSVARFVDDCARHALHDGD